MSLAERAAKLLSELLSDQFDAEIKIILEDEPKEAEPNVSNMPTDTMPESMSQRNASDCA